MLVAMSFPTRLYFKNPKELNLDYLIKQMIQRMINSTVLDFCCVVCVGLPFITNLQVRWPYEIYIIEWKSLPCD